MQRLFLLAILSITATSCAVMTNSVSVDILVPKETNLALSDNDRILMVANYRPHHRYTQNQTAAYVDDSLYMAQAANHLVDIYRSIGTYTQKYVPVKYLKLESDDLPVLTNNQIESLSLLEQPRYIVDLSLFRILIKPLGAYTYKVNSASIWRVYDVENMTLVKEFVSKDSLYYDQYQRVDRNTIDSTIASDISFKVGSKMANNLFADWQTQYRYYITTQDYGFDKVKGLVASFSWSELIKTMRPFLSSSDKNAVYAAAFNTALACEMLGNIDLAKKWLDKAKSIKRSSYAVNQYMEVLEKRKKEVEFLSSN